MDNKSAFDRVSHSKLFSKLIDRGVPCYLVLIFEEWYDNQRLCVEWGNATSDFFHMRNGIRQGSIFSPHLFNIYIDELNSLLSASKLGCHIGKKPANSFAYADDIAILAPTAFALNLMLDVCYDFASKNFIEFSARKTVVIRVKPPFHMTETKPSVFLNHQVLTYVEEFKYLGHIINEAFRDDEDIERERRNLAIRGNILIRKYGYCSDETKCLLFRSFCYQLYTCALWTRYKKSTLDRLRVCYNKIMRQLVGLPPWHSASNMFVGLGVRSFQETQRILIYSLYDRVNNLFFLYHNLVATAGVPELPFAGGSHRPKTCKIKKK